VRKAWALFGGAFLILALLSGCGKGVRQPNLFDRVSSGLAMAGRVISLPSNEKNLASVIFVVEIRYSDLQFIKTKDGYSAIVDVTFSLKEKTQPEQVRLIDRQRTVDLKSFAETVAREKILRVVEPMMAPVGEYTASILATDHYAKNQSFVSYKLQASDYLSSFRISEPLLMVDSLATFDPDRLIPLRQQRFVKDFFALVIIAG